MTSFDIELATRAYWRVGSNLRRVRRLAADPENAEPLHPDDESEAECMDELDVIAMHSTSPRLTAAAVASIHPEYVSESQACESSA